MDQEARQEPLRYKNHVNVDRRPAGAALSCERRGGARQPLDEETALAVWADSAYRSAEIEAALKEKGLRSRIRKGRRNKPLSEREKQQQDPFVGSGPRRACLGAQSNDMGGTLDVVSGWCRRRGSG